jgi:hypothetical protein
MGQMYLQRFVYGEGVTKAALDQAWGEAFKAFAQTGNWGNVDRGVKHHQSYGTGWGGYALIEVDDPEAFGRYQMFPQPDIRPRGSRHIRTPVGHGSGVRGDHPRLEVEVAERAERLPFVLRAPPRRPSSVRAFGACGSLG